MSFTFVLAPDSFKESMTAKEVCVAMEAGLRSAFPDARFLHVPMADGGEGTVQSLVDATGGIMRSKTVAGPLGLPVVADYGVLGSGAIGLIEMASASGLALLAPEDRDPRLTSTYGTGELIRACLDAGVRRIIIGIGGSATNDAGAGMAQALGARLLDAEGLPLPQGGAALAALDRIDLSGLDPRLAQVQIEVACDVANPLCGPNGASAVYGPQKGGDAAAIRELDAALAHFAQVVARDLGRDVTGVPGAGAAGGLGAGLLAFTHAELRRGIDIVIEYTNLARHIAEADMVITGEGKIDSQTQFGKNPFGVAHLARQHGRPVIAVAGCVGDDAEVLYRDVFDAVFPIIGQIAPKTEVFLLGAVNVERTCRNIGRLLALPRDRDLPNPSTGIGAQEVVHQFK